MRVRAARSRSSSSEGLGGMICVTAYRSPTRPSRSLSPWPFTRSFLPLAVPGGMVRSTEPRSVGAETVAPSVASAMVSGRSRYRSRLLRLSGPEPSPRRKYLCGSTCTVSTRSPVTPSCTLPSPRSRICVPSWVPGGIVRSMVLLPEPRRRRSWCEPPLAAVSNVMVMAWWTSSGVAERALAARRPGRARAALNGLSPAGEPPPPKNVSNIEPMSSASKSMPPTCTFCPRGPREV